MNSGIRIIKSERADAPGTRLIAEEAKTDRQRDREIVRTIRTWINEFELTKLSRMKEALSAVKH